MESKKGRSACPKGLKKERKKNVKKEKVESVYLQLEVNNQSEVRDSKIR